jgi:FKBP-type peptidyl-prolyl cis-trans isomerase
MKIIKANILTAALSCMFFVASCTSNGLSAKSTEVDTVSYAMGINIGQSLGSMKIEGLSPEIVAKGISDMLTNKGEGATMTYEEAIGFLQTYFQKQQMAKSERNTKAGQEFLEKNKAEEGVRTTASGLQYKIITPGTGVQPEATDEVEVHYRGTLLNGDEFDSSYGRGQPIKFRLNGVIRGWTEGLQLMTEGSKAIFWIPSELAYGAQGNQGGIEPNSTLTFEIELLKVIKTEEGSFTPPKIDGKK